MGLDICTLNREQGCNWATKVAIWVQQTSKGLKFDLGMTWYVFRGTQPRFEVINEEELGWTGPGPMTLGDVFSELGVIGISASEEGREATHRSEEILVMVDTISPIVLFRMGMAFAAPLSQPEKKIRIANRDQILRTPHKSFANVFLALAEAV